MVGAGSSLSSCIVEDNVTIGQRCRLAPARRSFTAPPYVLYPIPCTLYPIPYILYPIPCTQYPIPCTLYPIPYTLNPIPNTLSSIGQRCCLAPARR